MENLKQLVADRGAIRTKLTLFRKYNDSADVMSNIVAFEKRFEAFEKVYDKFDAIQLQIEAIVIGTEVEKDHLAVREKFEDNYYEALSKAQCQLRGARGDAGPSSSPATVSITPAPSDSRPMSRLPVLKLSTFDGDFGQWIRFRDTFCSLVHNSDRLTDIDRFNYLISSLSGSAASTIESFSVSEANYRLAWERLRERFDDPKGLITHHINSLLDMELVKRQSGNALGKLIDTASNNISALRKLLKPEEMLDAFVSTCVTRKLDNISSDEWDKRLLETNQVPPFKELARFLEQRSQQLSRKEAHSRSVSHNIPVERIATSKARENRNRSYVASSHVVNRTRQCPLCTGDHTLQNCQKFLAMPFSERHEAAKQSRLCFNCFGSGHSINVCKGGNCRKCGKKHHTLLHREHVSTEEPKLVVEKPASSVSHVADTIVANTAGIATDCTVLSTAVVFIIDQQGKRHQCRALLDVGSQANFVNLDLCKRLALPRRSVETIVGGLGQVKNPINSTASLKISSSSGNFHANLSCLVIDSITEEMPNIPLSRVKVPIPSGIVPADPEFYRTGRVDILIGAGLFWDLLCVGQVKTGLGNLVWQKTRLGWVLGGSLQWPISQGDTRKIHAGHAVTNAQLDRSIARFWEVEEIVNLSPFKNNDPYDKHFIEYTTRDEQGRFVVALPFNDRVLELGESRNQAEKRFLNIERKFRKNPEFAKQYRDFLREYLDLGHMTKLEVEHVSDVGNDFYLPHHAVMKENSSTTKLRVVFDGSAKTSTGVSLNDTQLVGKSVQDDLFSILIRFRKHKIVISADIAKMYRQVLVREEDRKFQRILWRFSEDESLCAYSLNTVTYGTASASYLATRALQQVGKDCSLSHPSASKSILNDFYVDDLLTGCETVEQAMDLRESITGVLAGAGFPLRKWASNDPKAIGHDNSDAHKLEFRASDRETKTLGLLWFASNDVLGYNCGKNDGLKITKRQVLSEVAQIFDPLGIIGPIIVKAKLFMQGLWAIKIGWDESLPQDLHSQWSLFRSELAEISSLEVPRRALLSYREVEVHGFSDASERAYGAALYLRSRTKEGSWVTRLLCAKSRVAPLKTISVPRLELCGAVLLAQLLAKARNSLSIPTIREYCWTDSQVVLAWIKDSPSRWKTFVANRATEVQTLTTIDNWSHVASADNPADLLSRGTTLSFLKNSDLWWHGPNWLSTDEVNWPRHKPNIITIPEERPIRMIQLAVSVHSNSLLTELITRYSDYNKLIRVVSYIIRFTINARRKRANTNSAAVQGRILSVPELESAERAVIRAAQKGSFDTEIRAIESEKCLNRNSLLLPLHPFLDEHGILRVGGRLQHASLAFRRKHPIVIPNSGPLATLLIRREHLRLLHAGCQQTLASLHSRFWVISGRRLTRKVLRGCMKCFRSNPSITQPQMGNLPADRITPARAFATCGVDYAGPFFLVDRGRSRTVRKAYVCLFVCLVTKAVHIELAVDLSTDAFLQCFHRFISRRGRCRAIYSDNGTNFVGARNELKELEEFLSKDSHNNRFSEVLAKEHIEWHFIPPHAPHFGGLWERGVRSVKTHMKRVIGEQKLTFDELYTILTQIEACLNSRPLHPLSTDPLDLNPLTPGHFLVGEALTALPQADLGHIVENRLSRFQLIQQLSQHFWKRWQRDYLHGLQQRQKWRLDFPNAPTIGAMVLIKEDNLPPMKWSMGRIVDIHPGQDGIVRVVSIKTANGILKRPTTRVCLLPSAQDK